MALDGFVFMWRLTGGAACCGIGRVDVSGREGEEALRQVAACHPPTRVTAPSSNPTQAYSLVYGYLDETS